MRAFHIIGLLLFFTAIASSLWSQNPDWTLYTDGSRVTCVACDGDTAWVGTEGGLCKIVISTGERTFYNVSNSGLPSNNITCIAIDALGRKWIGAFEEGIACFDENNWTVYNSANTGYTINSVECLAIDNQNRLWAGTFGGLAGFDGNSWSYITVSQGDTIEDICFDSTGSMWLTSVAHMYTFTWVYLGRKQGNTIQMVPGFIEEEDLHENKLAIDSQDNKWLRDYQGLARFDNITWEYYPIANTSLPIYNITDLAVDTQDNLWFGSDIGLIKFDGINWILYNPDNSQLTNDWVEFVDVDTNGRVWVLSTGYNTYSFQQQDNGLWATFNPSNSGLPCSEITCIDSDDQDVLWMGVYDHAYLWFGMVNFDGNTWTSYNTHNSDIPSDYVFDIGCDSIGNKWIAFSNSGMPLVRYNNFNWVNYTPPFSLQGDHFCYVEADSLDHIWVTTDRGYLACFSGGTWNYWSNATNSIIPTSWPKLLTTDSQNNLYVGYGGLNSVVIKYDGNNWTSIDNEFNYMEDIVFDSSGDMWVGTNDGLIHSSSTGLTVYNTENSGIPDSLVLYLAVDSEDNIWMITKGTGTEPNLTRFDGTHWSVFNSANSGFPDSDAMNSLYFVNCLTIDHQDRIWIGTQVGLCMFNGIVVGNEDHEQDAPEYVELQCFPNPFSSVTNIKYELPTSGKVNFSIYNIKGQLVRNIYAGNQKSGRQNCDWDGKDNKGAQAATGVYFIRMKTDKKTVCRKMMLIKG